MKRKQDGLYSGNRTYRVKTNYRQTDTLVDVLPDQQPTDVRPKHIHMLTFSIGTITGFVYDPKLSLFSSTFIALQGSTFHVH